MGSLLVVGVAALVLLALVLLVALLVALVLVFLAGVLVALLRGLAALVPAVVRMLRFAVPRRLGRAVLLVRRASLARRAARRGEHGAAARRYQPDHDQH